MQHEINADRLAQVLETNQSHAHDGRYREHGVSEDECQRMHDLEQQGYSNRQIGERVGYSYNTVTKHLNDHCSHGMETGSETGGEGQ